ncbi:NlpC/P60 family protein [Clostridium sp. VAP41]|uniref:XkdQ/YqbQ family protein n=1 Tax=Clostridium sp. VAP41 TaxID=2949979 RepID=UPI002079457C|nr:NlpC/P60 family protein [Clostridium sp. VAP41]
MKDLVLRITKYDNPTNVVQLQDYCTEVKLSNSFTQIAAELNFTMPHTTLSSSLVAINVELGDTVTLHYKDKQLFYGKVITTDKKAKEEAIKVTCYDFCWWICKSNITKNFSHISILQALTDIYGQIEAPYMIDKELGSDGDRILDSHLVVDKPAHKALQAIYSEITKQTGVYYYMHQDEYGVCTITEADKYYSNLTIKMPSSPNSADGNLIDYEINESMENMITSVAIYNADGSKAKYGVDEHDEVVNTITLEDTDLNRFGNIQESMTMDENGDISKAKNEAKQLLQKKSIPNEELEVTCLGDIDYRVAYCVMVKIPGTKYYDVFMYILSSEWTWNKDGTFTSKLTLSPSKHHDLTDFKDIEEKQDEEENSKDGTGSDLVNRILEELKKHLGLPYLYGGKAPSYGGMDCSGYIAYVYNQFSSELEITSNSHTLTSQTYAMMNEAKDVTSDWPDNLRECDIVFPHSGHVQAYVGDGKVIHSPQTGDVIKISDLNRSKIAKVIRVIPDSAWNNGGSGETTSNGYSAQYVELAKELEGFVSSWDNSSSYGAIGYGTDASGDVGKRLKDKGVTSCTEAQATEWLKEELNNWAKEVKKRCDNKGIKLNQYCFDCMVDICYQWGNQKWSMLDLLASGDIEGAKSKIKSFGYPRRDNARCNMLNGKYVVND